jgi:ABC-type proline/glycine betaine transport system permease subunit
MSTIATQSLKTLKLLSRAAIVAAVLTAPVLGVAAARSSTATTIEAPALKKSGAGLVLLLSLQRG